MAASASCWDSVRYLDCRCIRNLFWDPHYACPSHLSHFHYKYLTENVDNPSDCLHCSRMSVEQRALYVRITVQDVNDANQLASASAGPATTQLTSKGQATHHAFPPRDGEGAIAHDLTEDVLMLGDYGGMYTESGDTQEAVAREGGSGQQATLDELSDSAPSLLKKILPAAIKANGLSEEEEAAKGPTAPFPNLQPKQKKPSAVPLWPMLADLRILSEDDPTGAFKSSVQRGRFIEPKVVGLNLEERPWPLPDPLFRDVFQSVKRFAPSAAEKPRLPEGPRRKVEEELQNVWFAGSRISSAVATGGLVATYAAALVDPSNDRHVQAVTDLSGDYQSVAQAFTNEGVLRYVEELYNCVNVMSAALMTACTESFVVTTAVSQARRRLWLAEANVGSEVHSFLMARKITPKMLFSLDEGNLAQLKLHLKDVEALAKAFQKPNQPATKPAEAASPATKQQKWRAAFKNHFVGNSDTAGRGRGRGGYRGKRQSKGRGSAAQLGAKKGRGDPAAGAQA